MSLATRLSAFFLAALALVLAGFSGTLYLLARTYLVRQLDERLAARPGHARGRGRHRAGRPRVGAGRPAIAAGRGPRRRAHVRWAVRDGRGALVDRSANAGRGEFPADWSPAAWPAEPAGRDGLRATAPGWRLAGRRLELEDLLRQGRGHPDDEPGYEVQYPVLVLVVGLIAGPGRGGAGDGWG